MVLRPEISRSLIYCDTDCGVYAAACRQYRQNVIHIYKPLLSTWVEALCRGRARPGLAPVLQHGSEEPRIGSTKHECLPVHRYGACRWKR